VRGYAIGDRVSQPQYGTGTIRLVDEYHTVIDFDDHGIRQVRDVDGQARTVVDGRARQAAQADAQEGRSQGVVRRASAG